MCPDETMPRVPPRRQGAGATLSHSLRRRSSLMGGLAALVWAVPAWAQYSNTTMLQYFEASWETMRYRMPDVFMAGYDAAWLPPPQKGGNGSGSATSSIGYDCFDRFDLGSSASPTRYGTESDFRLAVAEFHRANCRVFVDWIMNHNATADNSTPGFEAAGGYPGFVLSTPTDPWGDFHAPGTQSENPGGSNYNLFEGRLVNLIDIAQEKNHPYIRHPVDSGDANNIPPGTQRNLPNPDNRRLYPDRDLAGMQVVNPGTSRNPGQTTFTFYPFNLADPTAGDAVTENATGLLMRATQYYLEALGVDGFRLDAAKHVPTWFWDTYWDAIVYHRWRTPDGAAATPLSFVEAVGGGGIDPYDWVRKDGFGNRDALDLDEAGALRDMVDNPSSRSWADPLNASIDNRDGGLNNGSLGMHHVSSHDNANSGTNLDTFAFAYVLMRSGNAIVYHNAFSFGSPPNNFPRRNGRDDALGLGSDAITTLCRLRHQYVRGRFDVLNSTDPVNPSLNDIIVMQHSHDYGASRVANVLVGVSDLQSNGQNATDQRSVLTDFAPGTRLQELTGNASNPVVDVPGNSNDDIAEVLTVDSNRRVLIKVPRNRNSNGVNHGRGYVVYGPAAPSGTLAVSNVARTIPADSSSTPAYRRRLTPVDVIQADTFEIQLTTTQTDPLDPNTDDLAVFRIDGGFVDYNGNGAVDFPGLAGPDYGCERFLTENSPLYYSGNSNGTYRQVIDAALLGEGYHYIEVLCYRHRGDGGDPIFRSFRKVIYIDRLPPSGTLLSPTHSCNNDVTTLPMRVVFRADDLTVDRVHIFLDRAEGANLQALADLGIGRAARDVDRFSLSFASLVSGNHRIDVLAYETTANRIAHFTYTGVQSTTGTGLGPADMNADGRRDGDDLQSFLQYVLGANTSFSPPADINCDGRVDPDDVPGFVSLMLEGN